MSNLLVTTDDVNVHLPSDKLSVSDADLPQLSLEAERIIRGTLAGVLEPTLLAGWTTAEVTPQLIRAIAGRFIAAFIYARAYSEDSPDIPVYAQQKYNEAMVLLNGIAAGTQTLENVDGVTIVTQSHSLSEDDFWPNSTSAGPKFRLDLDFGGGPYINR